MSPIQDIKTDAEKEGGCLYWRRRGWRKDTTVTWSRPGFSQTDRNPVTCVSWNDANTYLTWKREKTGLSYRLPTEAEWEYAARSRGKRESLAGTGNTLEIDGYAWFRQNSEGRPHPVGQKKPNGLGLYDMSGNVWEWVADQYHAAGYYQHSPRKNPKGPVSGKGYVIRGGSWYVIPKGIRTAHRNWTYSYKRYTSLGFRLSL
ncbi:MAG: formylglycine-generating enzyme family protein [Nitrospiria bacterium]